MQAPSHDSPGSIDNALYDAPGDIWWQPDRVLHLLKTSVNPARVGYFRRVLFKTMAVDPAGKTALEVGCGGGILCEEIARMGFAVTGVDPSEPSLRTAREHARASGLTIRYECAAGEALPFAAASFDVVFCCDVLEHVGDVRQVVAEFARVLKPGGVLCYDTINRTLASWLVMIKIAQDWKRYAFMPPRLHAWRMFIRPAELEALFQAHGLDPRERRGMKPARHPLAMLAYLKRRARGKLDYGQFGDALAFVESQDERVSYMGYAVRQSAISLESRSAPR